MYYETIGVTHTAHNDIPWVPWEIGENFFLKLFRVDAAHGVMMVMLKVPGGAKLGRHRHTGYVQLYTVQGAWRYLEHSWTARAGDVVYETADSVHSFETEPGEDLQVFVVLNGTLQFLDDSDQVIHVESWRTMLERQRKYCEANGLKCPDVSSFVESN